MNKYITFGLDNLKTVLDLSISKRYHILALPFIEEVLTVVLEEIIILS